jgi:hypothetical protein
LLTAQRQQIWKIHTQHRGLVVAQGIDWEKISLKYELSGGFIKNAVMSALLLAIARYQHYFVYYF